MRFILTVAISAVLGAALAPTVGPWVREQAHKGAVAAANYINDHLEVKTKSSKTGSPVLVRK